MKTQIIILVLIFTFVGCTGLSRQNELFDGVQEPVQLKDIKLTVTKMSFLDTGWICLKRGGYPAYLHPLVMISLGCATLRWEDGQVVECDVVYSTESVLEHELNHCRGFKD